MSEIKSSFITQFICRGKSDLNTTAYSKSASNFVNMDSFCRTLLFTTSLCITVACQSSIDRVRNALTSAPDWYTNKQSEIVGEGYPDLICRADVIESLTAFEQELEFDKDLFDKRVKVLAIFAKKIDTKSSDGAIDRAKELLNFVENNNQTSVWSTEELNRLKDLLESLPEPS